MMGISQANRSHKQRPERERSHTSQVRPTVAGLYLGVCNSLPAHTNLEAACNGETVQPKAAGYAFSATREVMAAARQQKKSPGGLDVSLLRDSFCKVQVHAVKQCSC
jgi:hypothetical protein